MLAVLGGAACSTPGAPTPTQQPPWSNLKVLSRLVHRCCVRSNCSLQCTHPRLIRLMEDELMYTRHLVHIIPVPYCCLCAILASAIYLVIFTAVYTCKYDKKNTVYQYDRSSCSSTTTAVIVVRISRGVASYQVQVTRIGGVFCFYCWRFGNNP